jgi:2-oxoglutarate ferredoxin oxidoreductase subunit beta
MDKKIYEMGDIDIAWCPGCGNYHILSSLKQALAELNLPPQDVVVASGIGQGAKVPHYLYCNFFNGLHGRSIPPATAIKASNPGLTVISESGDGDQYGEGGNHMIHAMRRNPDITVIVHDNMVYGLTKGQASPTTQEGYKAPIQPGGVFEEPFNPIALGVAMDASFVARANAGDDAQTTAILKKAITHRGFALVDVFQSCVTFNKVNTYRWFKDNTYYLPDDYDPTDRAAAFAKALETEKRPLGVIYVSPHSKPIFHEAVGAYATDPTPLYARELDWGKLRAAIDALK